MEKLQRELAQAGAAQTEAESMRIQVLYLDLDPNVVVKHKKDILTDTNPACIMMHKNHLFYLNFEHRR